MHVFFSRRVLLNVFCKTGIIFDVWNDFRVETPQIFKIIRMKSGVLILFGLRNSKLMEWGPADQTAAIFSGLALPYSDTCARPQCDSIGQGSTTSRHHIWYYCEVISIVVNSGPILSLLHSERGMQRQVRGMSRLMCTPRSFVHWREIFFQKPVNSAVFGWKIFPTIISPFTLGWLQKWTAIQNQWPCC